MAPTVTATEEKKHMSRPTYRHATGEHLTIARMRMMFRYAVGRSVF